MSARARVKHSLESNLRRAIEGNELELHYQPKIDARTYELIGFEALARWPHTELGYVSPTAFIPLAEETGLIVPISEWILETACRQIRRWSDDHGTYLPVAINISAREFTQRPVDGRVADALRRHGLPADALELEITESIFMNDLEAASAALFNLRDIGVRCSIDDFGTGYSGLTYLSQLPIYSLKIDRSFIQKIGSSLTSDHIVDAVITVAHSLQMHVIAEGVETEMQARFLQSRGCDAMQGFLFGPPLPFGAVDRTLAMTDGGTRRIVLRRTGGDPGTFVVAHDPQPDSASVSAFVHAICTNENMGEIDEGLVVRALASLHTGQSAAHRDADPDHALTVARA